MEPREYTISDITYCILAMKEDIPNPKRYFIIYVATTYDMGSFKHFIRIRLQRMNWEMAAQWNQANSFDQSFFKNLLRSQNCLEISVHSGIEMNELSIGSQVAVSRINRNFGRQTSTFCTGILNPYVILSGWRMAHVTTRRKRLSCKWVFHMSVSILLLAQVLLTRGEKQGWNGEKCHVRNISPLKYQTKKHEWTTASLD